MTQRREKSPTQRQLRVGEELRHALSRILARGLRDPELMDANITVTEVRMSPDLKNATVFVTPFGDADPQPIVEALVRATPFLRSRLGQEIKLRYTPNLSFKPDTSFDEAARIDALLRQPRVQADLRDDDGDTDTGEQPDESDGEEDKR